MLFASDLDQTLIYSKRFIIDPLSGYNYDFRLIEIKGDEEISFMTKTAIDKLKDISKGIAFVPVTTRTIEQYERITLFQKEIQPEYAIVSNGGNVIINGNIDVAWNNKIKTKIINECLSFSDMLKEFGKISSENWVISQKQAEDLFLYFIIKPTVIPHHELIEFEKWVVKNGWTMSVQGRKLYLVPGCVNKREALSYVKECLHAKKIIAAGDSLLDLCMLELSDYALAPGHGELAKVIRQSNSANNKIHITVNSGILAADEILENIKLALKSGFL